MKNMLASDMEVEIGVLFVNFQLGSAIRISLHEMVHIRPPTYVDTQSDTGDGYNSRQRRSREINILLYWVQYILRQGHYLVYWERGKDNIANHSTKHHQTKHHHDIRITCRTRQLGYNSNYKLKLLCKRCKLDQIDSFQKFIIPHTFPFTLILIRW